MRDWQLLQRALAREPAVLVTVERVEGSGPREVGAWMALTPDRLFATIGGGQLEFEAIAQARALLAVGAVAEPLRRYALGPSLGQCCGGVVHLRYELLGAADIGGLRARLAQEENLMPVALFGGGHVGRAIIALLGRLPARVLWVDSRDEIFPAELPDNIVAEHSEPVQAAVGDLAPGSRVLIMSFSHAEDLDVVAACLQRQRERADLPYVGLIGSKSKWASFRQRLLARGFSEAELARVTCPIGVPGISGKQPEVIAVAVVAQLLQGWR
ncbi:xanthine dehydrogenase accessory protein XdhC [Paucibacter sp. PLA-PC-4]|uniref:xanthine dehydrogenase accessory protein XdhC n=1 Tax=Paucibacter sp. PLA-PC-4 TaxID=2993655 RepID=UPI002248A5F9|nr:xanthine dehydrogenase accessory protein XdhC [Paucibacter sp. PLA-PC-4]MCX2860840.1 xanthine dehydrogenase accessory protein XdhC [Paucibacter sp. PLA-PC-4]